MVTSRNCYATGVRVHAQKGMAKRLQRLCVQTRRDEQQTDLPRWTATDFVRMGPWGLNTYGTNKKPPMALYNKKGDYLDDNP